MKKAVVLLSGGLVSAIREGFDCHALSVNYGQHHQVIVDPTLYRQHA